MYLTAIINEKISSFIIFIYLKYFSKLYIFHRIVTLIHCFHIFFHKHTDTYKNERTAYLNLCNIAFYENNELLIKIFIFMQYKIQF